MVQLFLFLVMSLKLLKYLLVSSEINQFKQINRSTLNAIIKPRVEETLEIMWQKLKQYGFS